MQGRAKREYSEYTAPSVLKGLETARLKIYIFVSIQINFCSIQFSN